MKLMKLLLVIMAAAVIALALGGNALAFHGGSVARCSGCHTMHNSQDGTVVSADILAGTRFLLKSADASSACLDCHAGYGQKTDDGSGYGSGGDYYWITRTWTWTTTRGTTTTVHESKGHEHGHNIIAAGFNLPTGDPVLTTSPGGNFPSNILSCASCHDPHGKGDAVLLLRSNGPYANGQAQFPAGPVMRTMSRRTTIGESGESQNDNHVVYGSGMSAWCGACHGDFADEMNTHMHPTNKTLGSTIADNYNQYISSDDFSGGINRDGKYLELVPFETGDTVEANLPLNDDQNGPTSTSKVACISCHRAHATAFQDSGRWDFAEEFLQDSHPDGGATDNSLASDKTNSYYGRTINTAFPTADNEQRSLCNKCHAQDQ